MKKTTQQPAKKLGRPPNNKEPMVLITVSVTEYQKKLLGRDRSQKVRMALIMDGYPEKEPSQSTT